MAATRKLQGEIDRCLKKVSEGVETFEDIWQKVYNATNNNQKEKYETDLKKEIKKLQRLRDQIKSWIANGEIKDKSTLIETRKLIETQMERFKVVERETKTKAYSKEGLGASVKLDPTQREREDLNQWLINSIDVLQIQMDQFESEIESILANMKKKKLDKDKQDRLDELKIYMERHKFHMSKLETLMRMLDNVAFEGIKLREFLNQVKKIKDDIEYYLESSQEAEFEENEFLYDDIEGLEEQQALGNLALTQDLQDLLSTPTLSDGQRSPSLTSSLLEEFDHNKRKSESSTEVGSSATGDKKESTQIDDVKKDDDTSSIPNSSNVKMIKPLAIKPTLTIHSSPIKEIESSNSNSGTTTTPTITTQPVQINYSNIISNIKSSTPPPPLQQQQQQQHQQQQQSTPIIPSSPPMEEIQPSIVQPTTPVKETTTSSTLDELILVDEQLDERPCSTNVLQPTSPVLNGLDKQENENNGIEKQFDLFINGIDGDISSRDDEMNGENNRLPQCGDYSSTEQQQQQMLTDLFPPSNNNRQNNLLEHYSLSDEQQGQDITLKSIAQDVIDKAGLMESSTHHHQTTTTAIIPPLLGVAPLGPVPIQKEHLYQLQMLASSFEHLPFPSDSERMRQFLPRNPFPSPSYYPQHPITNSDSLEFFQRLSIETLFFIFYYLEGTKAQYLAAKVLKKQSWRFHTKYMMWFQRHEEPKIINEDYEQGTYIYFDIEKWGQRKKDGFVFEYRYLEDRELG